METGTELVMAEIKKEEKEGGPEYNDVVKVIPAPGLAPPPVPELGVTACRIADALEISVHDARQYKADMSVTGMELVEWLRILCILQGINMVMTGLLLAVAAFH